MGDLLGVVLCGGESRRMGSDKGLLRQGDYPWALVMGKKLEQQHLAVVYSIHPEQQAAYSAIIPPGLLVTDRARTGRLGPLEGLLSVHEKFPDRDLLLLACDMPDMDALTLQQLIDSYAQFPSFDFYAYTEQTGDLGRIQPFCCIYTAQGIRAANPDGFAKDGYSKGLRSLLQKGNVQLLRIENEQAFKNYNHL